MLATIALLFLIAAVIIDLLVIVWLAKTMSAQEKNARERNAQQAQIIRDLEAAVVLLHQEHERNSGGKDNQ